MKYMLDTNICIYAIKRKSETLVWKFLEHDPDELCISTVTYAELMHGVEKSGLIADEQWKFEKLCLDILS